MSLSKANTTRSLLPGQFEHFSYSYPLPLELQEAYFDLEVRADDQGDGTGRFNECEDGGEDNNAAAIESIYCGVET